MVPDVRKSLWMSHNDDRLTTLRLKTLRETETETKRVSGVQVKIFQSGYSRSARVWSLWGSPPTITQKVRMLLVGNIEQYNR
jgi:hypothetical protein